MLQSSERFIKRVDLFAQPLKLLINKEDSHKTLIGALLSMVLIMIMVFVITTQLDSLFRFQNPVVIQSEGFKSQPDLFYLTKNNFTLMFGIQDPDTYATYANESIFYFSLRNTYQHSELDSDGKYKIFWDETPVPIIKCSVQAALKQEEFVDFFKNHFDLSTTYCIDYDKIDTIKIQGTFTAKEYRALTLDVHSCVNSTTDSKQFEIIYFQEQICAPQEVIDSFLNRGFISYQVSDTLLNLKNQSNPQSFQIKDMFTTISNTMNKEIDYWMSIAYVDSDKALVFSEEKQNSYVQFSNMVERIDFGKSSKFCSINFRLEEKYKSISIRFNKLQDTFGNIGGIWSVLFTIFSILLKPIQSFSTKTLLVNQFFNFEEVNSKENQSTPVRNNNKKNKNSTIKRNKTYNFIINFNNTQNFAIGSTRINLI